MSHFPFSSNPMHITFTIFYVLSEIRRRKYHPCGQQWHRYANLLNRNFKAERPNSQWVTDISYIPTQQGVLYRSVIRDLFDNSIVAYKTSPSADGYPNTAQELIDDYIHFYNFERFQMKYRLMPSEKRHQSA